MTNSSEIPTIYGGGGPLAYVPDDLTVPQFFLDGYHPLNGEASQLRKPAYFIEDGTGRECRERTTKRARGVMYTDSGSGCC